LHIGWDAAQRENNPRYDETLQMFGDRYDRIIKLGNAENARLPEGSVIGKTNTIY
jgi:hypothetical protein